MCRFLAYRGAPVFLEELVAAPAHSLIHQSLHAEETKTGTNGDGFGIGWYGSRPEPGFYRELRPAWSDENLLSLCRQVSSQLFFAHVRAATGTATTRANCHPFTYGKWMFMHNGQIGGYHLLRRKIEALIPDSHYVARTGTTDSEAIFLAAIARGLESNPIGAMASVLNDIVQMMEEAHIMEPLRFTAALTNGQDLFAFRWASDTKPATLYLRETDQGIVIVSEPLDHTKANWQEIPRSCALIARANEPVRMSCMNEAMALAA